MPVRAVEARGGARSRQKMEHSEASMMPLEQHEVLQLETTELMVPKQERADVSSRRADSDIVAIA